MQDLFEQIVHRPPGHGLPPRCYTDDDFLDFESNTILQSEWHCLGRVDEVPEVGDFFTIDILSEPLVVVRKSETEIAVLSNVCRHRGMPVAEGAGNTNRFRCPYHAWTYALDGKLRAAPLVPRDQLQKECALPEFQSRCWQGFIFFCISEETEWPGDITGDIKGDHPLKYLEDHVANYHMKSMRSAAHFTEVWDCNWKSLVENFMDGYHLSVVHPETLHHLTPTSLCKKVTGSNAFTAYTANYAGTAPARENHHPSLTVDQTRQSQLFCVFPALIASVSADTLVYLALHPLSADRVSVKWGLSTYESDLSDAEKQVRIEKWQQINAEDHQILQRLHSGLKSSRAGTGPLAEENFEGTLSDFHHYLISKLGIFDLPGRQSAAGE